MSYDFRDRRASEVVATYKTTAGTLARILFRCKAADLLPNIQPYDPVNAGNYPGTNIPLKRVPENAPVTLILKRAGGLVEDEARGWIADRFGPALGAREAKRAAEQLEREGVLPEAT